MSTTKNNFQAFNEQEAIQFFNQTKQQWPILLDLDVLKQRAEFYKALGDETRLKILAMLSIRDLCLCEILSGLQAPSSTINHHLKILERGNVITFRKEGKFTIYSLRPEIISQLGSFLNTEGD